MLNGSRIGCWTGCLCLGMIIKKKKLGLSDLRDSGMSSMLVIAVLFQIIALDSCT